MCLPFYLSLIVVTTGELKSQLSSLLLRPARVLAVFASDLEGQSTAGAGGMCAERNGAMILQPGSNV